MASKQAAKANKMSDSENENEKIDEKKGGTDKPKRKAMRGKVPKKRAEEANKVSESENESDKEVVEKKGGSDKPKRKAAGASNSNAAPAKAPKRETKKRTGKVEEKKKEVSENEDETASSDDQKVPLLDQPLEVKGSRVRRIVDIFNAGLVNEGSRRHYDVEILDGKGTKLKEIPCIVHELKKSGSEDLKTLHRILFSRIGNVRQVKDNIMMFSGFSFEKDATEYRRTHTALSKLSMAKLKTISQLLCLPKTGKQPDYIERILEFLLKPTDTGKAVRESRPERKGAHSKSYKEESADKEGGTTRNKRRGKTAKSEEEDDGMGSENGGDENKDDVESDDAGADGDDEEVNEEPPVKKNKKGTKSDDLKKANKPIKAEEEDEPQQEIENGKDDETEDKKSKKNLKPKAVQPKKRPAAEVEPAPAKETTGRRQNSAHSKKPQEKTTVEEELILKEESEEEEEDDVKEEPETSEKTNKRPPTDDEIKAFVKTILDDANLEEITMKTVCKQVFEHYPGFDLSNKKEFIKVTVKSFISVH